MRIVFIGPPGAGKGTQCIRLSALLGLPHLSTGDVLRAAQAEPSAVGRKISRLLDAGHLAPDYLVWRIVKKCLLTPALAGGCLFDGFPRTINQAIQLDEFLAEREDKINLVLNLVADEKAIVRRLLKRGALEERGDDNEASIAERMRVFSRDTAPVLDYYKDCGLVQSIDAMRSPDAVFDAVHKNVSAYASVR